MEKQQETQKEKQVDKHCIQEDVSTVLNSDESSLQQVNKDLSDQISILQEKLLRQLAESENIRNRSTKLIEEEKEYAIFNFTQDLIPVMDNLERSLEYLLNDLSAEVNNLVEGIKMTKDQLASSFSKHHLESINPNPGDKFDFNIHHAISQVVTEEFIPGSIVKTMQVGYKIKGRLIRPSAVTVATLSKE
jgi:molecular chaperone GrpE